MGGRMDYRPSWLFRSGHMSTCYPTLFRKVNIKYKRERIETPDGDFLDIDWIKNGSKKVIVLCHGLEGSANSNYIKAIAKYFSEKKWDVLALNYRGCSGVMNKKPKFYNMGDSEDLHIVLKKKTVEYKEVVLAGFSLGAGLILNYFGHDKEINENIKCGIAVSPPCDPLGSSKMFDKIVNIMYRRYFLQKLKRKMREKAKVFPQHEQFKKAIKARTIREFDELYTAPQYGYRDAIDYYENVNVNKIIKNIRKPVLILMAEDDPIMSESCYPRKECQNNSNVTLQITKYGGHVGYVQLWKRNYWLEERMYEYIEEVTGEK